MHPGSYAPFNGRYSILKTANLQIIWEIKRKLNCNKSLRSKPTYKTWQKGEPLVHKKKPKFKIGKSIFVKRGDLSILGVGNALSIASECGQILKVKLILM